MKKYGNKWPTIITELKKLPKIQWLTEVEAIDKKLEGNIEATEERMAILSTEIYEEVSNIRREGEMNKQKIVQTETDINHRIDSVEEIHNNQVGVIERKQTEMMAAHTRCV